MAEPVGSQSRDFANARVGKTIGVAILIVTAYLTGVASGRTEKRMKDYESLRTQYQQLEHRYSELEQEYDSILRDYPSLRAEYEKMQAEYAELKAQYDRIQRKNEPGPSRR